MHDAASQRTICTWSYTYKQVRLFGRGIVVRINNHKTGTTLLPPLKYMAHYVDLSTGGICTPDNHLVGVCHFPRVDTGKFPGTCYKSIEGRGCTDGLVFPGVALRMAESIDPIAHNQPHCAGKEIRPYGL